MSGEVLTELGRGLNTLPLSLSISMGSGCIWSEACQAEAAKSRSGPKGAARHKIIPRLRLILETHRGSAEGFTRKMSRRKCSRK